MTLQTHQKNKEKDETIIDSFCTNFDRNHKQTTKIDLIAISGQIKAVKLEAVLLDLVVGSLAKIFNF